MKDYLSTAGGRIKCLRCMAKSVRSGKQCLKPALKSSNTQKCGHHGGRNKGPITEAGKARSAEAQIKTGEYTKQALQERSQKLGGMLPWLPGLRHSDLPHWVDHRQAPLFTTLLKDYAQEYQLKADSVGRNFF